jgi:hypothetical protein
VNTDFEYVRQARSEIKGELLQRVSYQVKLIIHDEFLPFPSLTGADVLHIDFSLHFNFDQVNVSRKPKRVFVYILLAINRYN